MVRVNPNVERGACKDCGDNSTLRCMECHEFVCGMCMFSMHAMCQPCRAAYRGPIWQLGQRADAYLKAWMIEAFRT